MEFQVRCMALFLLFSVIDGLEWFWTGSLHKNIQLILVFLKVPFFCPTPFLLYICALPDDVICNVTFMLLMLLSTLSVIKPLICGINKNWLLNWNLIFEILLAEAGNGLLISMLEKLN